ncbi:MAG: nucleotidyltransferase family protein [Candidatus Omnitrophota bacterium]
MTDHYPAIDFSFSGLAPEEKLVVLCSRVVLQENIRRELGSIINSGRLDWERIIRAADEYRVMPFLNRHLQIFGRKIPEQVKDALRNKSACVFSGNIKALEQINIVDSLLAGAGVEALFIKGAALMVDVYGENGLRGFSDIDILVKEKEYARAEKVLTAGGFKPSGNMDIARGYRSQRVFLTGDGMCLDVHRKFVGRVLHNRFINISEEAVWGGKRALTPEKGAAFNTLSIYDTLLYHCVHLSMHHSFSGLMWYVDLNEFIGKYNGRINWEIMLEKTAEYRIKRPVYYALLFAKNIFDTCVPERVFSELATTRRKWDKWIFKKVKLGNNDTDYLTELAMFDRRGDAIKFIFLNIILYPYLIIHFLNILSKAVLRTFFTGRAGFDKVHKTGNRLF